MSLNNVFAQPKPSVMGPALYLITIVLFIPAMFVGLTWIVVASVNSIIVGGVTFWPVLGLLFVLWVVASWFAPKKK